MAALTAFYPYITPDVPGAPLSVVNAALLRALQGFCRRTELWQVTHSETEVSGPSFALGAALPAGTSIARVVLCQWDDQDLDPHEAAASFSSPDGVPAHYGMSDAVTLVINPSAQATGDLEVVIAVMPVPGCTAVADELLNDWFESIAAGALARLLAQSGKPWADPPLVAYHQQLFEDGVNKARRMIRNGRLSAGRAVRSREFY